MSTEVTRGGQDAEDGARTSVAGNDPVRESQENGGVSGGDENDDGYDDGSRRWKAVKKEGMRQLAKSEIARERWNLLASALLERSKVSVNLKRISIRRFESYGILKSYKLENGEQEDGYWIKYEGELGDVKYSVKVFHLRLRYRPCYLTEYNNTGNICIWPSEEVLAYYILSNLNVFHALDVIEIGGGMSCLAGLMLGKYGECARVDLTDGNKTSVDNVRLILRENKLYRCSEKFGCFQLNWSEYRTLSKTYDVILCSDCLFPDEGLEDLVETMWWSLRDSGFVLVMAPRRGNTLDHFTTKARNRGFHCVKKERFDKTMWSLRKELEATCEEYVPDLHYPCLVLLAKTNAGFERSVANLVFD